MDEQRKPEKKKRTPKPPGKRFTWVLRIIVILLVIAAIPAAVRAYSFMEQIYSGNPPAGSSGDFNINPDTSDEGDSTTIIDPGSPNLDTIDMEPWDGASRVTLLVIGLDYRDWLAGEGPPRSDTMMLLTLDPPSKTAGMLSIPRDLWVDIPGYGHGRINTAYQLGEATKYPGGGPALAIKTVEDFLGVDIHYYAQVDFDAFVRFIGFIGGIQINVTEPLKVDVIGKPWPITLQPGPQVMDGDTALAYARARYTEGGDFDRADRQQEVIFAIRDRVLEPRTQAKLLTNALSVYQDLSRSIQTNLGFEETFRLGLLALEIDLGNIQRAKIGKEQVLFDSVEGQDVLKPIPDKIRAVRDSIFTSPASISPALVGSNPLDLMKAEAARVSVYNGSSTAGLAGATQEYLLAQGVNVVEVGNADLVAGTRIIDYTGNPYTVKFLVELLGISPNRIYSSFDPNSPVDVQIILGPDWTIPQPQ